MNCPFSSSAIGPTLGAILLGILIPISCPVVDAQIPPSVEHVPSAQFFKRHIGGALEESYRYHRNAGLSAPAAPGTYRYGFPVDSYRWGWFGATHYYPRVLWHKGYYGDSRRWSYRRGY